MKYLLITMILLVISACNMGAEEYIRKSSPDGCFDAILMVEKTDTTSHDIFVLYVVPRGENLATRAFYGDRPGHLVENWAVAGEILVGTGLRDNFGDPAGHGLLEWSGENGLSVRYSAGRIHHFRSPVDIDASKDCPSYVNVHLIPLDLGSQE